MSHVPPPPPGNRAPEPGEPEQPTTPTQPGQGAQDGHGYGQQAGPAVPDQQWASPAQQQQWGPPGGPQQWAPPAQQQQWGPPGGPAPHPQQAPQQPGQPWQQPGQGYGQQWTQPSAPQAQQWGSEQQGGYGAPPAQPWQPAAPPAQPWQQPAQAQQWQQPDHGAPWGAPPPAPARSRGLLVGILAAVVVVAVAVTVYLVFFAGSDAEALEPDVSASTQASVSQLVVGNCLESISGEGTVDDVSVVPCSNDHTSQVLGSTTFRDRDFPGQSTLVAQTSAACTPALVTSGAVAPDDVDLVVWTPSESSWSGGDRVGLCIGTVEGGISTSLLTR